MTLGEMIKFMIPGVGVTFQLVPLCIITTLIVGLILGVLMFRGIPGLNIILNIYKVVMRGVPAMVVLKLLYYNANFQSAMFSAFVALSLYHSAYIAEIVRGCLEAIPEGQMIAGESLGVNYWKIMLKIYIPQIVKPILPMLCGQYVLLVKDTTLVYIVGVTDLMWLGRQLMAQTFNPIIGYLLIGIFYYLLCFIIEALAHMFERRAHHDATTRRLSSYY